MPNDSFGVKKIYPDSTKNPQSFYLQNTNDPRIHLGGDSSGLTKESDYFYLTGGNNKTRITFYTTAGYASSKIEKDHSKCASRGYMMDPKDWRNVEMTGYFRVTSDVDDEIVWYCRGGTHTGTNNCEGFAYKAALFVGGRTRFAKEQYHVHYNFTNQKSVTSDIEGRWIGYKFCCYDDGTKVNMEIWIDENESNSWRMVDSRTDSGGFGEGGTHCNARPDQIGLWGGPHATMRWDNFTRVDFKKVSIREIDAGGVINEGGSNSSGGQQNGGTGSTGSGSSGGSTNNGTGSVSRCTSTNTNTVSNSSTNTQSNSGNDDEEDDDDTGGKKTNSNPTTGSTNNNNNTATPGSTTNTGGGNVDKFGVQSAYARGEIKYDWRENFKSNGSFRWDFTGLGSSRFVSAEIIGYFGHHNTNDEVAGKMGGGNHTDGSHPKCYDIGIGCQDGDVRYRLEENHPSTGGGKTGPGSGQGGGIGFGSKYVGYRFVKRNQSNGVLLEVWQDQGNNEGDKPANQWKKIGSWVETGKVWKTPPSDHQETIRIDDVDNSIKYKWISLREIKDGDSSTAPQNPPNDSSPGGGGGGSDGGSDGNSGNPPSCSCDSGSSGGSTGTGDDMCDSDGDGIADTPGSGGGAQPEPPPIETLTSDFTILYNIATDVTDSCTFGNPLESIPYEEVYKDASPDAFQYQDLGYAAQAGNTAVGLIVANTESILFNKIPRKIVVKAIKRTVDALTATCSGDLFLRVRNTADNRLKYQFGTEVDVASIDVNDQELTFTKDDNKEPLKVGDMILLEYYDASAHSDKCIKVKHTEKDKVDGVNSYLVYRRTTGYVFSSTDQDFSVDIYT